MPSRPTPFDRGWQAWQAGGCVLALARTSAVVPIADRWHLTLLPFQSSSTSSSLSSRATSPRATRLQTTRESCRPTLVDPSPSCSLRLSPVTDPCSPSSSSVKNTVYIHAKTSPYVLTPELFALHLGLHFTKRYDHIASAHIKVTSLKWTRIDASSACPPSVCAILHRAETFSPPLRSTVSALTLTRSSGTERRSVSSPRLSPREPTVVLPLLPSAVESRTSSFSSRPDPLSMGSGGTRTLLYPVRRLALFTSPSLQLTTIFLADAEVDDRIFSTSVTCEYTVPIPANITLSVESLAEVDKVVEFEKVRHAVALRERGEHKTDLLRQSTDVPNRSKGHARDVCDSRLGLGPGMCEVRTVSFGLDSR